MNRIRHTLFLIAALAAAACEGPLSGGDAVVLSVTTDGTSTKVSYGPSSGGITRLDWAAGDRVSVHAAAGTVDDGAGGSSAVYTLTGLSMTATSSFARAVPEENSLYWAPGAASARFFGCFPPLPHGGDDGIFEGLSLPGTQAYAASPDLSSAPMIAGPVDVERLSAVSLQFRAAYSAFEVRLSSAGDALPLLEVALLSPSQALWGVYSCDVAADAFSCPARTPLNGILAMDMTGQAATATPLSATLLALPQDYSSLSLRVRYLLDGETVTATLPLSAGGTPISFPACAKAVITATALSDGGWRMSVASALTVKEWTLAGNHVINYDATVEVSSGFSFSSTEYDNVGVTVDEDAWTVTFNTTSSVAYISFTIDSPVGADWVVQKVDPEGWFILEAMDGGVAGPARGVVDGSTVTLRLRPDPAMVAATRSTDYSIILHTYVEVGSRSYNIDTETQNLEHYDYARFIIPAND